ncbi:hypothetical protein TNCV_870341 [Trichonephila clavipes]|nr:hypothetical protein TNCV_870341 [Trichonephila clavipes]
MAASSSYFIPAPVAHADNQGEGAPEGSSLTNFWKLYRVGGMTNAQRVEEERSAADRRVRSYLNTINNGRQTCDDNGFTNESLRRQEDKESEEQRTVAFYTSCEGCVTPSNRSHDWSETGGGEFQKQCYYSITIRIPIRRAAKLK